MDSIRFDCKCLPKDQIANWIPLDPKKSRHSWRIQCLGCDKFIKWGSNKEYHLRMVRGEDVKTVLPPPPASLEPFFE